MTEDNDRELSDAVSEQGVNHDDSEVWLPSVDEVDAMAVGWPLTDEDKQNALETEIDAFADGHDHSVADEVRQAKAAEDAIAKSWKTPGKRYSGRRTDARR